MTRKISLLVIFAFLTFAGIFLLPIAADENFTVMKVTAHARDGEPLVNVLVYSYSDRGRLDRAITDGSGECIIKIPKFGEFDLVFGGGLVQPAVLEQLYGGPRQAVRKTLLQGAETDEDARRSLGYSLDYISRKVPFEDRERLLEGLERRFLP